MLSWSFLDLSNFFYLASLNIEITWWWHSDTMYYQLILFEVSLCLFRTAVDVSSMFGRYSVDVRSLFRWCSIDVPSLFCWCSIDVPSLFRWCSIDVPSMFRPCFVDVSSMFRRCFEVSQYMIYCDLIVISKRSQIWVAKRFVQTSGKVLWSVSLSPGGGWAPKQMLPLGAVIIVTTKHAKIMMEIWRHYFFVC